MEGPQGHYAKWIGQTKKQILYELSYRWNLNIGVYVSPSSKIQRTDWWYQRQGVEVGEMGGLFCFS